MPESTWIGWRERDSKGQPSQMCLRAESKFSCAFKLIWAVQTSLQKYFASRLSQISSVIRAIPSQQRGVAHVINVGRDAVDARASGAQRQSQGEMNLVSGQLACKMIGALADGEAVWF